jgi:Transcriptional regulators
MKDIVEIEKHLEHINKLVMSKYRETAQKCDLTDEQFHLLIELYQHQELMVSSDRLPPTVGEIAADIGNAPNTLSEKIKRLEKKDLVKRVKDNEDLRITRLLLTDKGYILMDSIKNESTKYFIYNALEKMDEKSLNNLLDGLKQLNENLFENI